MSRNISLIEKNLDLACKILRGQLEDLWGHVAVRHPNGDSFLLKYIRPPLDGRERCLRIAYDGKKMSGPRAPPRELPIYTSVYASRPDVNAVVHCHPETVISLSIAGKTVLPVDLQSFRFVHPVPVYQKPVMICTAAEGRELTNSLGNHMAVIIRGHGAVTVSDSLQEAVMLALQLEKSARIQTLASLLGAIPSVPEKYIRMQIERTIPKEPKSETSGKRLYEWRYYSSKSLTDFRRRCS